MDNLSKTILHTIEGLEEVTNYLYKQDTKKAYQLLNTVINDLLRTIDDIFQYKKENENFNFEDKNLVDNLNSALQAMESGDSVLLADILQYEIIEQLNEINQDIN